MNTPSILRVHTAALACALLAAACALLVSSCATPPAVVEKIDTPKVEKPSAPDVDTRVFRYEDRYFVTGAAIDKATNIDDPLQALRVIQIREGADQVLVISAFDRKGELGATENAETWFGIEMPSFAPGTYDVAKAAHVSFYRFLLGDRRIRYDGQTYAGTITIEGMKDGALIGVLDVRVSGITKSFDASPAPFTFTFSGSFRIRQVPIEATKVGK